MANILNQPYAFVISTAHNDNFSMNQQYLFFMIKSQKKLKQKQLEKPLKLYK